VVNRVVSPDPPRIGIRYIQSRRLAKRLAHTAECVVLLTINFCHVQKLKLASLVHGGGWQELESLLDLGRLDVEEGGEGLEVGGFIPCHFQLLLAAAFRHRALPLAWRLLPFGATNAET